MFGRSCPFRRPHVDLYDSSPTAPANKSPRSSTKFPRSSHPMDAKMRLAKNRLRIPRPDPAQSRRKFPARLPRPPISHRRGLQKIPVGPPKKLITLLVELKARTVQKRSERLIKQGGVELNQSRNRRPPRRPRPNQASPIPLRARKKKFLRSSSIIFLSAEAKPPLFYALNPTTTSTVCH